MQLLNLVSGVLHKKKEIMNQMSHIANWGGQFIVLIPKVTLYNATGTEINNDFFLKEENK